MNLTVHKKVERNVTIDTLRGFAILCVVLGHVIQKSMIDIGYEENIIYKAIYSFHMPLLMLLSGYLFYFSANKYLFKELFSRKVVQILWPIFVWNTIYFIIDVLFFGAIDVNFSIKGYIQYFFTGLWFLWAILFYSILLGFIHNYFKGKAQWIMMGFSFMVLLISPNRWRLVFEYVFFIMGFKIHTIKKEQFSKLLNNKKINVLFLILTLCILILYCFRIDFIRLDVSEFIYSISTQNINTIGISFVRLIAGYSISTIVCIAIGSVLQKTNACIQNVLSYMGKISLQIYLLQRILVELIYANILKTNNVRIYSDSIVHDVLLTLALTILSCFLIILFNWIIKKGRVSRCFFGR